MHCDKSLITLGEKKEGLGKRDLYRNKEVVQYCLQRA